MYSATGKSATRTEKVVLPLITAYNCMLAKLISTCPVALSDTVMLNIASSPTLILETFTVTVEFFLYTVKSAVALLERNSSFSMYVTVTW